MLVHQLVIMVVAYAAAQLVEGPTDRLLDVRQGSLVSDAVEAAVITLVAGFALWRVVVRPLRARSLLAQAEVADREAALRAEASGQEFRARLHRALEMATTEASAYAVADRALEQVLPEHRSELLLADSSEAHLKVSTSRGPESAPSGCSVGAPHDCPAIRRGQTAVFANDGELDACPFLHGRADRPTAAVCIPVNMIGRSIGVLHTVGTAEQHPSAPGISELEVVADQVGARIGMLRVMEQTHLQAATDSLTGLINRRTVENNVREMLHRRTPFAIAMGDLDHFKALNDTHGHEAGDRALRLFARVIRSALRGDDLISRFGGEEFVVVFPHLTADQAVAALQRVQEQLLVALGSGDLPPFTASFGVAHSDAATSLEELVRLADHALFTAKREGRNRVILDSASRPLDQASSAPEVRH